MLAHLAKGIWLRSNLDATRCSSDPFLMMLRNAFIPMALYVEVHLLS